MGWWIGSVFLMLAIQGLFTLDRGNSWRQRFHQLGYGGDSLSLFFVFGMTGAGVGSFIGETLDAVGAGAGFGAFGGLLAWLVVVVATSSIWRSQSRDDHTPRHVTPREGDRE